MSTPKAGLVQYRSAANLIAKLFTAPECPKTLEKHRVAFEKFQGDLNAYGKEWIAAIAPARTAAARPSGGKKTKTAGAAA